MTEIKKVWLMLMAYVCLAGTTASGAAPVPVTTTWEANGKTMYETGFSHRLMKSPQGGVQLFNMELIESDAPGAGASEKGGNVEAIFGALLIRKVLSLSDVRAKSAWLVLLSPLERGARRIPLTFSINGVVGQMMPGLDGFDGVHGVEFPAAWLREGENVIELSCPTAQTQREGWAVYVSRADEFEAGGGDPKDVGKASFRSQDNGKTWQEGLLGRRGDVRGEYSVRLSLDRFVSEGWLASPVNPSRTRSP